MTAEALTCRLNDFDANKRRQALQRLVAETHFPVSGSNFNMHCHSFFSYNAEGWSPTRVAYECRRKGLSAAGLCDFDVLDGLDEFLEAGHLLGLRSTVHLETRAYVAELSEKDISSPGEPGVTYIMGCGFARVPNPETAQSKTLAQLRKGAQSRNLALINRVNTALPAVAIDYDRDVLPLTPKDVATERHIVRAYCNQADKIFPDIAERAAFWAPLLKCNETAFAVIDADIPKLEDLVRNALAKRGGIGYSQPTAKTFPLADDFIRWVLSCGAIPTIAWLDGTSDGEANCDRLLDLMTAKGCAALNIIPDRNWNLKKQEEAEAKRAKLDQMVNACVKRHLPINVGTEMNKGGLPFVDDLAGPVLRHYAAVFTQGMYIMIGQSLLARYANAPYLGERAQHEFKDLKKRNAFFASVGALPPLDARGEEVLLAAGPDKAFTMFADAVRA